MAVPDMIVCRDVTRFFQIMNLFDEFPASDNVLIAIPGLCRRDRAGGKPVDINDVPFVD